MSATIPDPVYELLENHIDSFEKLELVLALARVPGGTSSIDSLAQTLTLSREEVRHVAAELRAASLVNVTSHGDVQLMPPTSKEAAAIEQLVALYRDDRFVVVKALGEISLARIRNLASRAFADAFIIGKRSKKGGGENDG